MLQFYHLLQSRIVFVVLFRFHETVRCRVIIGAGSVCEGDPSRGFGRPYPSSISVETSLEVLSWKSELDVLEPASVLEVRNL